MKEYVLNVKGMVCGGCENRVQNAVKTINGVKEVVASHVDGTVKIVAKDDSVIEQAKEKIQDLDFEVV